ncbi:hypothetical protein, partial [Halalkalibacterium halodurans]|uniref:hypothetical protein n=1 Tax=Halalkalibacterium halodurans TaxID=86665 RepID=UPI001ABB49CF
MFWIGWGVGTNGVGTFGVSKMSSNLKSLFKKHLFNQIINRKSVDYTSINGNESKIISDKKMYLRPT